MTAKTAELGKPGNVKIKDHPSEQAHTLGPWRIVPRMLAIEAQVNTGGYSRWQDIARCMNRHEEGEAEANARLIAAAPELLKALELLIASVGSDPFSLTKQQRADMDFARVAVIKATS